MQINSVDQAFHEFNQILTQVDHETFAKRFQTLSNFLHNNLYGIAIHEIVKSGSYGRKTNVDHGFDLDVVVLIGTKIPYYSASYLYHEFAETVKKAMSGILFKNRHALTFKFRDHFKVDLVPAYGFREGPWYIVDSWEDQWVMTDPKKNKELLIELNQENKNKLLPTIRFFKKWNGYLGEIGFRSFHLETIICDIFVENDLSDLSWTEIAVTIPSNLKKYVDLGIAEPAGVGPSLFVPDTKVDTLKEAIDNQKYWAKEAYSLEVDENKIHEAINTWKNVFGNQFGKFS